MLYRNHLSKLVLVGLIIMRRPHQTCAEAVLKLQA